MHIGLILTSQNRFFEVGEYLKSLTDSLQNIDFYIKIDLVFISQNPDFKKYNFWDEIEKHNSINFKYILIENTSLSAARNIGLEYLSKLDTQPVLLGFPDDDCKYNDNIFTEIYNWYLSKSPNCKGLGFYYPGGRGISGDFDKFNLFGNFISFSVFVENNSCLRFDEKMGVGCRYGACEETDYLMRILGFNNFLTVSENSFVMHPDRTDQDLMRMVTYGRGFGYFSRKILNFRDLVTIKLVVRLLFAPSVKFLLGKKSFKFAFSEQLSRLQGFFRL